MKRKKKIILIIIWAMLILILLTGCGKNENVNNNEKNSNGTMLDDETLKKIENFKMEDNDDNWITILKPTHKQAINYPFKGFGLSAIELGEGNCWTPNKHIKEINNVNVYSTGTKAVNSYDEFAQTKFKSFTKIYITSSAQQYENGSGVHILDDFCLYTYDFNETTIGEALSNGYWTVDSKSCSGHTFMIEDVTNIKDTELYIRLLKEWGMPSEVYYKYTGVTNSVYAYMVYDCDGYDVWFDLYDGGKNYGIKIHSVTFIGDGYFNLDLNRTLDSMRDKVMNEYTKMK